MSEYLIRTLLNDIDIEPPPKLSIKYPKRRLMLNFENQHVIHDHAISFIQLSNQKT